MHATVFIEITPVFTPRSSMRQVGYKIVWKLDFDAVFLAIGQEC